MIRFFSAFVLLLTLSSCSTTKPQKSLILTPSHATEANRPTLAKLYDLYEKYAGVKYCYGGTNQNGIDCSALVQNIYKEAFGITIPRTTKQQIKVGILVEKKSLKEGDILFFKTSYKNLHSAIYLEKGEFIHASSKHGVTRSSIHNPYWRARYLEARRILY
jgi:lipoprotein Spr/probable lipoprotein NlpC